MSVPRLTREAAAVDWALTAWRNLLESQGAFERFALPSRGELAVHHWAVVDGWAEPDALLRQRGSDNVAHSG